MYSYAFRFDTDETPGLAVFCRDLPEFNSYSDEETHALREVLDGIETTLSIYVDRAALFRRPAQRSPASLSCICR